MSAMPPTLSPPATSASWQIKPLPDQRAPLAYARRFSAEEHARVVQGLVPVNMEDKWFIYFEDGLLRLHRSWTGACIYGVRLAMEGDESVVTEAWVSRATGEYTRTDDAYDARLLSFLIERLLLRRDVAFPVPDAIEGGDRASLYRHHVVGNARASDEEP
jgi:hypothetical protein